MKKIPVSLLVILFTISACGPLNAAPQADQSIIGTAVAATMQAMSPAQVSAPTEESPTQVAAPTDVSPTQDAALVEGSPTQTTQTSGISIDFENITFIIPDGLASDARIETFPADSADAMGGGWPAYTSFTLNSYPLQGTMMEPVIRIFRAEELRLRDPIINEQMDILKEILSDPNNSLDNLPVLPIQNAARHFQSQAQVIEFQNGSGIRYLTQFDQYPAIVSNQEMFYMFMGLSQDGNYFISAYLPASAAFLPADSNPETALPIDGIPYPTNNDIESYYTTIAETLNGTDPSAFNPTLPILDALIRSIQVK